MPSNRRLRVLGLLVVLAVIVTLYITSAARQTQSSEFYVKTSDALAAQKAAKEASFGSQEHAGGGAGGDEAVAARLKEAESAAKKAADRKAEEFHGEQIVDLKRKEAKELKEKAKEDEKTKVAPMKAKEEVLKAKDELEEKKKAEEPAETEEEIKAKEELTSILKKSPVIIFSKSYCGFSRKAKNILLNKYDITPAPFVVELDQHPLGQELQALLAEKTGRRTVPNVLINGKSIGGGDDVENLHLQGKMEETIKTYGGKRMEVSKKAEEDEHEHKNR